jgi:hypothetical protein
MRRWTTDTEDNRTRRASPRVEGLEERWVLSLPEGAPAALAAELSAASGGVFRDHFRQFVYTAPTGTRVLLQLIGRGSLEGTYVDEQGALHLRFRGTNSFSKIFSSLHGGNGRAPLADVIHLDLAEAPTSLSGIGASLIGTINLPRFDLIPGGRINVTEGINILALNSMGPGSEIQLRAIPPELQPGQPATTTSNNVTNNILSNVFLVQTLAGSDGEFISAGNIVLQSEPGDPGPPPAPPGVVLKINNIRGNPQVVPNLLTDAKIFGYDPATQQVIRFSLNLLENTGVVDPSFAPISVTAPAPVGVSLGRAADRLVLLVSAGSEVSAYDATYGTFLGSFTTPAGFSAIGSTDAITVIGNPALNQLQMVDIAASLAAGTAVPPASNPANYTPPAGLELLGGLTGLPGSHRVYTTTAATFNALQPLTPQLGFLTVDTVNVVRQPDGADRLVRQFRTVSQSALQVRGAFVPIPDPSDPELGEALGSVDRSLALGVFLANPGDPSASVNQLNLLGPISLSPRGIITLAYPNPITDFSETFRPDLAGSALIDIQGDVQSLRGLSADGMVLNVTGNLNLIRTGRISNSTIVAQPVGHVLTSPQHRTNVSIVSSRRDFGTRNGVTVIPGLRQIGPLSLPRDRPNA